MYTIKINDLGHIELYLHNDCECDIHYVSKEFLREFDFEGNGGEYIVRDENHSTIAFF